MTFPRVVATAWPDWGWFPLKVVPVPWSTHEAFVNSQSCWSCP